MSPRRVHVVVLCEGFKDYQFARRCLVACGWRNDQITSKVSPSGKESAFTYVLDNYTKEVQANRSGKKMKERALLVLVDADKQAVGARERDLAQRLDTVKLAPRRAGERIAIWVPRRQMETWVRFLLDGSADVEMDYRRKYQVKDPEYVRAAGGFAKLLKQRRSLASQTLPSLKDAVAEFARLNAPSGK